ncbi:MAG: hypothetical protein JRI72_03950 [Deltaproteobacteria bacterium]|nr:hypothetical protein [Deltaproteobacteria bacterium]
METKSHLIRIDGASKDILDRHKGKLSYNQFFKSISSDLDALDKYRKSVRLLNGVERNKSDWQRAVVTFIESV